MTHSTHTPTRRRLRWRLVRFGFRISLALVLLLAVGIAAAYWFVFSPQRLAGMAQAMLERSTGGQVSIESAELDLAASTLDLRGVTMRARGMDGPGGEIFASDRVEIAVDRGKLWRGEVELTRIILHQPRLTLTEDLDRGVGHFNLSLLRPPPSDGAPPRHLPRMAVQGGQLRYATVKDGRFELRGSMGVDGQFQADSAQPTLFHLTLDETAEQPGENRVLVRGHIDLRTMQAQATVTGLRFVDRYFRLLPHQARAIWADAEPTGRLPQIDLAYDRDQGPRALIELTGLAINVPQLAEADQQFRMQDVTGLLRITERGITIEQDLVGAVVHRTLGERPTRVGPAQPDAPVLHYRVSGSMGLSPEDPFSLSLKTEDRFLVPEEPRYIFALPLAVQKFFHDFNARGKIEATVAVIRQQHDQKPVFQGTATVYEGRGHFQKFPYDLTNVRGKITFNERRIRILSLRGETSGGGSAIISGIIEPPGDNPAVDLTVSAINIPLHDPVLRRALEPKFRPALDMFFHEPSYQALLEAGHYVDLSTYNQAEQDRASLQRQLRSLEASADPEQRQTLEAKLAKAERQRNAEVFELGGRADVLLHITRTEGPGDRTQVAAELDIEQASILFEHFPYPLRVSGGKMIIAPGELRFENVEATGLHGGDALMRGQVELPGKGQPIERTRPDLQVGAFGVPIDALLLAALPKPQDQWVARLNLAGRLNVAGRIIPGHDGEPDMHMLIDLAGGKANPGGGDFALDNVMGRVVVSRNGIRIESVTATRGEASVRLAGAADWTDPADPQVDVELSATNLSLADAFLDAAKPYMRIDPQLEAFFERHELRGRFDSVVTYRQGPRSHLQAVVRPHALSYLFDGRWVNLTDTQGQLIVTPDALKVEKLTGKLGQTHVAVDGDVQLKGKREATLQMTVHGDRLEEAVLDAAPRGVEKLADALQMTGEYTLTLDPLVIHADAADGQLKARARGAVAVADGSMELGVDVEAIEGKIALDVKQIAGRDWPEVAIGVAAEQAVVAGRKITDLTAALKNVEQSATLVLTSLRGQMHGGSVVGKGAMDLDKKTYQLQIALSDVSLTPMMHKEGEKPDNRDDEKEMTGRIAASLDIDGRWDKPEKTQARGRIHVTEGRMMNLPLSFGLLELTHLSLPTTRAFKQADLRYYIKGPKLTFESITLDSDKMRLSGDGKLNLDTQAIDLTLTTSNPGGLDMGPLTDVIDAVRDQLVTIEVTGTLAEPKRKVRQFNAITQAWEDVFGPQNREN